MAIRLVLVRHGLSSFNAKGLIQGRTDDSLLTDEGYVQARKAGKALSKINFDKIYSSPLVRAAETAKTIKKSLNKEKDIIFDKNLLEVDLNEWSGLKIDEIKNNFPEIYPIWKNDPVEEIKIALNKVSFDELTERNKLILILSSDFGEIKIDKRLDYQFKNYS